MSENSNTPAGQSVEFLIGRLDGKVDTLLRTIHGYDDRITSLEKKQWWFTGAAAALTAFFMKVAPFAMLMPR